MTLQQLRPAIGVINLIVGGWTLIGARAYVPGSSPRLRRIVLGTLTAALGVLMLGRVSEEPWVWPATIVLYLGILWQPRRRSHDRPVPYDRRRR